MSHPTNVQYRLDTIAPGQLGYDEPGPLSAHEQATRHAVPTHRDVSRLVDVVRHGELNGDERDQLARLLDAVASAVRVAPTVAAEMQVRYPNDPRAGDAAALGAWEPVGQEFCRFLGTVTAGLSGPVAVSR